MKETELKFINKSINSGLMLIPAATGSGKSHVAKSIVCEDVIKSCEDASYDGKRFIYITPKKKNLTDAFDPEDVCNMLKKMADTKEKAETYKNYYQNNSLFLKANSDCVLDFLKNKSAAEAKMCKTKGIWNSMETSALWNMVERRYRLMEIGMFSDEEQKSFMDAERNFRKRVSSELLTAAGNSSEVAFAMISNSDSPWSWITEMYPSSTIRQAKYIIMSMDKFLNPIDPICDISFLMYEDASFTGTVLFMDEFDDCYNTILKKIVEDSVRIDSMIDPISLFRKITLYLRHSRFAADLFKNKLESMAEKYSGYIEALRARADDIFDRYHIDCEIKCDVETCESFVFFEDDFHTWINNDKKKLAFLYHFPEENINKIVFFENEKDVLEGGQPIELLVGEIDGFYKFFSLKAANIAKNYASNRNLYEDGESAQAFEAALHTFLGTFDIKRDSSEMAFFENLIRDHGNVSKRQDKTKDGKDLTFYERGIKYYTLINDKHSSLSTKINLTRIGRTPEKTLLQICRIYKVIGLSATCAIDSGIGNFDLLYIKMKLKKKYVVPTAEDMKRMREEFHKMHAGYKNINIHTELIGSFNCNEYNPAAWKDLLLSCASACGMRRSKDEVENEAQKILSELEYNILPNEKNAKSVSYKMARYLRIGIVYAFFVLHDDIQSFLCMLSALPGGSSINMNTLHVIFKAISDCCGKAYDKSTSVVLSSDDYENKKTTLGNRLQNNEKIFIMSCYQTIGSGQNLQYLIPYGKETIHVNGRLSKLKDLDGIYVDKPTHMVVQSFTNKPGELLSAVDVATGVIEREKLYEKNELARTALKTEIEALFSHSVYAIGSGNGRKSFGSNVNLLPGVCMNRSRLIIQAVGRICRTPNKNKTVYVLADASLVHSIDTKCTKSLILNPEAEDLFGKIENARTANNISQPETDALMNEARKKIYRVRKDINTSLKTINRPDHILSNEEMEAWESDILLKLPLGTREETDAHDNGTFWIEMPEESDHLYYTKKDDVSAEDIYFNNPPPNCRVVSAEDAFLPQLMKYDFIHDHFIKNHYATKFEPAKCIMTPTAFINLYKGRLGEACGEAAFKHMFGVNLLRIREGFKYEKMDFVIDGTKVYVDTKIWHSGMLKDKKQFIKDAIEKRDICGAEYAIFVNIMNDRDDIYHDYQEVCDGTILLVPALLPMDADEKNTDWAVRTRTKIAEVIDKYAGR